MLPGGMSHLSQLPLLSGTILPPEILSRKKRLSKMYEITPAMTPYAMPFKRQGELKE